MAHDIDTRITLLVQQLDDPLITAEDIEKTTKKIDYLVGLKSQCD